MSLSSNLALPYLAAGQAQKHVTVNEALRLLDALVQLAVESAALSAPPGSPSDGQRWIVGPAPTGAWAGQAGRIASWTDGAWTFLVPRDGWLVWDRAQVRLLIWRASIPGWQAFGAAGFPDTEFLLRDHSDPTRQARFQLSGVSAGATRTLSLPNLDATLAHLGNAAQTFAGSVTFSNATVTVGSVTTAATYGIGTGATASGSTKTVNIGTAGVSGSTTFINLGSTVAGAGGQMVVNLPDVQFAASVATINAPAANLSAARVGIGGATADSFNRLSVNAPAVLLNNAGAGIEVTVNKAAPANDASFAFKTSFSARALFGLLGSDDVTLKVSPDGSAFFDAFVANRATGRIEFAAPLLLPGLSAAPAAPAAGRLSLYARNRAGAPWLEMMRPNGRDIPFQPHFGVNRIASWSPSTTTAINTEGLPITSVGTVSHPAPATGALANTMRRWRLTSAATIDSVADQRSAVLGCFRGNAPGQGGFTFIARVSLATLQPTGMGFFGLLGSAAALAATQTLAAMVNCVGLGFQRGTHTNWQLVANDATGAPTLVDLGASFALAAAKVLTILLWAPPNGSAVWGRVVHEETGAAFEQEITADLPAASQFLSPRLFMNTGATAAAVAFDCAGVYLETDY
jgi:hypothetical protein